MPKRKTAKILLFELPERIAPPAPLGADHCPDIRMFPSGHRQSGAWTMADMVKAMQGVVRAAQVAGEELCFSQCLKPECLIAHNPSTGEGLFSSPGNTVGYVVSALTGSALGLDGIRLRSWYYHAECKTVSWEKAFGELCTPAPWERKAFGL